MKSWHIALAIGTVCSSHGLLARGVQIQDFQQGSAQAKPFVLVAAAIKAGAPDDDTASRAASPDGLAGAFSALGGDARQPASQAAVTATGIRPPAWMQTSRHPVPVVRYDPSKWAVSESSGPSCWEHPYQPNPALRAAIERRRLAWYGAMVDAACEAGVPVALFDQMIVQESGYNPLALSPKGAASLAQLMPDRARRLGVANIWDPAENMRGGARYLRALLDEFGRYDLALAAYNAGESRVRGTLQIPRITETINYVSNILTAMRDQIARTADNGS